VSQPATIAAILAGGAGERLGGAKPTTLLAGRALISYPLSAARQAGLRSVVVAKPRTVLPELEEPIVREAEGITHPLCGALAALRYARRSARAAAVVLLACDMPFLTPELLAWLSDREGAVIARVGGRLQPLLGRYPVQRIGAVAAALGARRSLSAALAAGETRVLEERELARFGDPGQLLFNVNDAQDLRIAARLIATPAAWPAAERRAQAEALPCSSEPL